MSHFVLKVTKRCIARNFNVFIAICVLVSMFGLTLVSQLIDYTSAMEMMKIKFDDLEDKDQVFKGQGVNFQDKIIKKGAAVAPPKIEDKISAQLLKDERREKLLTRERHLSRMYKRTDLALLPGFADGNFKRLNKLRPGPYMENYANPCWYEQYPHAIPHLYGNNCILAPPEGATFSGLTPESFSKAQHKFQLQEVDIMSRGRIWRLQCLPKVFLVGADKAGTAELAAALREHPLLDSGHFRESEVRYWTDMREGCTASLFDYADLYDRSAEKIRTALLSGSSRNASSMPYHPALAMDDTPSMYREHMCIGTMKPSGCQGYYVSLAHILARLVPQAKVLAIVSHPVERTYLSYLARTDEGDENTFHQDTLTFLDKLTRCVQSNNRLRCLLGEKGGFSPREKVSYLGSLYNIHLNPFKKAFRENMKTINLADYIENPTKTRDEVFEFIGLSVLSRPNTKLAPPARPMLDITRQLLDTFFRPYIQEFTDMCGLQF